MTLNKSKTIKYICDKSVDDIVNDVISKKWDIVNVIESSLESRKEYGLKVEELVKKLEGLKNG